MVLIDAVLRSRRKVMSVFVRLNLHAYLHICLRAPSPVLSRVICLKRSLSSSLYVRVRPAGCGIRSYVWDKHN